MKKLLLIAIGVGLTSLLCVNTSMAAEPTGGGQALEIAPPVVNLQVDPGETVTTEIMVRGISSATLLVSGQVNDFAAAGEDGTPKIMLGDPDSDEPPEPGPYSLISWITPIREVLLEPQQIVKVPITIRVPANAAPGGYYGVVRFTATAPELEGTGVALSASLGSLLFVRVSGDAQEGMQLEEFATAKDGHTGWLFEATPLTFVTRLKNTGNTHLQPAGSITITDMFGNKVATTYINQPPRNVLPDSVRKFEQPLDNALIGDKFLFGRYTADLEVTYGDDKQKLNSSVSFWVIPYRLIGIVVVALVGGFFLLRFIIGRYKQRILRQARGGGLSMRSRRK